MSKITVNQAPREGVLDEKLYMNNLNGDIKVNKEMLKKDNGQRIDGNKIPVFTIHWPSKKHGRL